MKKFVFILMLAVCVSPFGTLSAADTVVVIVNSENTQAINQEDVKNIYADRVINWDNGNKIDMLNLPSDSAAREVFARAVMGMSAREHAAAENNRKITNTIRNPSKTKRERLVVNDVSRNKDAIGYVSKDALGDGKGVRILLELQ